MAKEIELEIDGDGVSPETVQWRDLQEIVNGIQKAIIATAAASGLHKDDVVFCLKDIGKGSDRLLFATDDKSHASSQRIVNAIRNRDDSGIPPEAREGLEQSWKRLHKLNYSLQVKLNGSPRSRILIQPDVELFDPPEGLLEGKTALLVEIIDVGGENPTAKVVTARKQRLTASIAGRQLAAELGRKLYETIQVNAEVVWDTATGDLYKVRITGIGDYQLSEADPIASLLRVSKLTGGYWDSVDAASWMQESQSE